VLGSNSRLLFAGEVDHLSCLSENVAAHRIRAKLRKHEIECVIAFASDNLSLSNQFVNLKKGRRLKSPARSRRRQQEKCKRFVCKQFNLGTAQTIHQRLDIDDVRATLSVSTEVISGGSGSQEWRTSHRSKLGDRLARRMDLRGWWFNFKPIIELNANLGDLIVGFARLVIQQHCFDGFLRVCLLFRTAPNVVQSESLTQNGPCGQADWKRFIFQGRWQSVSARSMNASYNAEMRLSTAISKSSHQDFSGSIAIKRSVSGSAQG
jgi:hypothetical protein